MLKLEREIRKQFADLLVAEYAYWRDCKNPNVQDQAMGAMGSVSNVLAAVVTGKTPELYAQEIALRDKKIGEKPAKVKIPKPSDPAPKPEAPKE